MSRLQEFVRRSYTACVAWLRRRLTMAGDSSDILPGSYLPASRPHAGRSAADPEDSPADHRPGSGDSPGDWRRLGRQLRSLRSRQGEQALCPGTQPGHAATCGQATTSDGTRCRVPRSPGGTHSPSRRRGRYRGEHLHLMHDSGCAGGHPWDCTRTEARRPAHLFRTGVGPRSPSATLAGAVGGDLSLAIPRLVLDAGYSGAPAAERLPDRAHGGGVHRRIPKIVVILLVGHGDSAISLAVT